MLTKIAKSASESTFQVGSNKKRLSSAAPKIDNTNNRQTTTSSSKPPKNILSCRTCHMISISDSNRIMCPYCGSFYDPNFLKKNTKNSRRSNNSKNRRNSDSNRSIETTSEMEEIDNNESNNSSDTDTDDSSLNSPNAGERVKSFFKNLFSKRASNKSDRKECIQMRDKNGGRRSDNSLNGGKMTSVTSFEVNKMINAQKIVMHPFLTLESKDSLTTEQYRNKFNKTLDEFR